MRYKRNVSVFLNVQCNSFFSKVSEQMPDEFFYMGLYILLRRQLFIHRNLKQELSSGKPTQKIPQTIWIQYLKSGPHSRLSRLVECDIKHLLAYFKEVKTRMHKCLEICEVNETMGIFQKYFVKDEENFDQEAYTRIMDFLIELLKEIKTVDRNFITKLRMTFQPFKYLHRSLDFGIFYEDENEELEKLRNKYPELA